MARCQQWSREKIDIIIVNYLNHHAPHNDKFSTLLILRNIKSVLNIHFCDPGTPFFNIICSFSTLQCLVLPFSFLLILVFPSRISSFPIFFLFPLLFSFQLCSLSFVLMFSDLSPDFVCSISVEIYLASIILFCVIFRICSIFSSMNLCPGLVL